MSSEAGKTNRSMLRKEVEILELKFASSCCFSSSLSLSLSCMFSFTPDLSRSQTQNCSSPPSSSLVKEEDTPVKRFSPPPTDILCV